MHRVCMIGNADYTYRVLDYEMSYFYLQQYSVFFFFLVFDIGV